MPSAHRRIGLVVDEPVQGALEVLRKGVEAPLPEATLARRAVFEGAAFEAIQRAVSAGGENGRRAGEIVALIRRLLPTLELPHAVRADILDALNRSLEEWSREERRRRQLALLSSPNPYGEAALAYAEQFDDLERLPG